MAADAAAAAAEAAASAGASAAPIVGAASQAAASAAASAGPIVDAAGDVATAAIPVLTTGAQVAGTAATVGLQVVGKTVEIAGPVAVEGVKVAVPAVTSGLKAVTDALDGKEAFATPVAPTPVDVGEFLASPFGQSLTNAAPYFVGAVAAYVAGQVLLQKVKETIGPLIYPAIGTVGLGVGLTAAVKLQLFNPMDYALPATGLVVVAGASVAALINLRSSDEQK